MRDFESEKRRRKIEIAALLPLGLLFILLNWTLFRLYNVSATLPLSYALFFFSVVNLNVLTFLAIIFFLGRNLVKIYAESKPRMFGRSLKTRLFLAFISFAFIPTCLMFLVSVFYINNSFDKWFANRTEETLKHSSELVTQFISEVRKDTYLTANRVLERIEEGKNKKPEVVLDESLNLFRSDALEIYYLDEKTRVERIHKEKQGYFLPAVFWDDLENYVQSAFVRSFSRKTEQGEWLSTMTASKDKKIVLVASKVLPFTLLNTMESVANSRNELQTSKEFKLPLKSTYLFILVTMTLVILAFGGWFSLYLAQSLSKSLYALGYATKRISKGEFNQIRFKTGMDEINDLVENFNSMTDQLKSTRENLNQSISNLKEHSIYRNTLLSQISSGVISCDNEFKITLVNKRVENIFNIKAKTVEGKSIKEHFPKELVALLESFSGEEDEVLVHEMDISLGKNMVVPLQVSIASLVGVDGSKIGYIITVERVDLLRENQRVKAWKEVATRVAHEIKNPLTPIKLSAERLQRKFGEQVSDVAFHDCVRTILSQVELIKDLVNEFNQYARFPKVNPTQVNLKSFFEEIISIYTSSHSYVHFELKCEDYVRAFIDKDQMKRVFINLIDNSIEAMQKQQDKQIFIEVSTSASGKVNVIKFSDSGPGVPKDKWHDIFKSKYTTKKNSAGLGLSIVKKIIEDHGGRIALVRGEKGKMVFLIELTDVITREG